MFRTVIYVRMPNQGTHEATRFTSESVNTYGEAEALLEFSIGQMGWFCGGHIEQYIERRRGWFLCPEFAGKIT